MTEAPYTAMDLEFAKGIVVSVLLGFMIGLQREVQVYHEKSREFAGASEARAFLEEQLKQILTPGN